MPAAIKYVMNIARKNGYKSTEKRLPAFITTGNSAEAFYWGASYKPNFFRDNVKLHIALDPKFFYFDNAASFDAFFNYIVNIFDSWILKERQTKLQDYNPKKQVDDRIGAARFSEENRELSAYIAELFDRYDVSLNSVTRLSIYIGHIRWA
jgi:hypothetical protein